MSVGILIRQIANLLQSPIIKEEKKEEEIKNELKSIDQNFIGKVSIDLPNKESNPNIKEIQSTTNNNIVKELNNIGKKEDKNIINDRIDIREKGNYQKETDNLDLNFKFKKINEGIKFEEPSKEVDKGVIEEEKISLFNRKEEKKVEENNVLEKNENESIREKEKKLDVLNKRKEITKAKIREVLASELNSRLRFLKIVVIGTVVVSILILLLIDEYIKSFLK